MPEAYWNAETGSADLEKWGNDFSELQSWKAQQDVIAAALPQSADAYEAKLPADFQMPEGVSFEVDSKDPMLAAFRDLALKSKLSQETFSRLYGLYVQTRVAEQKMLIDAKAAETAKLGANGPARVDAVTAFLKSVTGKQKPALLESLVLADQWAELEKIIASRASGGFNQHGRQQEEKGKVPGYEKMTFAEKVRNARARARG